MKIVKWLNDPMSAINGIAIVRVEPHEIADAEQMLALVDSAPGFFGYTIELLNTANDLPIITPTKYGLKPQVQFGFPHMPTLRTQPRHYQVFVHRD